MRRTYARALSLLLVIVLVLSTFTPALAATYRNGAQSGPSSSYKGGKYYENYLQIPITGDNRTDLMAIALSQLGYQEGSANGYFSGEVSGSSNYVEFSYNMGDLGLGYGGSDYPWCASFVSWCLYQSRCTDQGTYSSMARYHSGDYDYIWKEISCSQWVRQLSGAGYFKYSAYEGGSYTPKYGDLVFFQNSSGVAHIGLCVYVEDGRIYTVEGNTSDAAGLEDNGGGVYFKNYSLSSSYLYGYGALPYKTDDTVAKIDYSGNNPTPGLYIANASKYIYASETATSSSWILSRFTIFEVTEVCSNGRLKVITEESGGSTVTGYVDNSSARVIQLTSTNSSNLYSAHGTIEVTQNTNLRAEPYSASDKVDSASVGTEYVTNGICVNSYGNYWYRLTTDSGQIAYISQDCVEYKQTLTSDITLTDYALPENHEEGSYFLVTGTVSASSNTLDKVSVNVYSGTDTSGTSVTGGTGAAANNKYVLDGSDVDDATSFGSLTTGVYTYVITADYTSHYVDANGVLQTVSDTVNLVEHAFTVGDAEIVENYFEKCTFYPSCSIFVITQDTAIVSEPRPRDDANTSVELQDVTAGTICTATGLYVNDAGHIFYQVETADGQTGYVFGGYTEYVKSNGSDVTITDYDVPNGHVSGNYFLVTGTVQSVYSELGDVSVSIYSGFTTEGTPVTGGSATATDNQYVLDGSDVDDATSFGSLTTGNYTYVIKAKYISYYAVSAQQLVKVTGNRELVKTYFTVIDEATDQSTCAHNNSETVIREATCTTLGQKVTACSLCGLTELGDIDMISHTYGSTVTQAAECVTDGVVTYLCDCGDNYTESIPSLGHRYVDGLCTRCGAADYDTGITLPTVEPLGGGLAFKDEICYNVYFGVNNPDGVEIVEMGLLTWSSLKDGTVANAEHICIGAEPYYGSYYKARTQPVAAKNMGENLYFKIYLKLGDGNYVYSNLLNYSARSYAENKLADENASQELKQLCVALMNYGAAAQTYFGYKTDDLMNAGISEADQALVGDYSDAMVPALKSAEEKGNALAWTGGFTAMAPSVNFGGALAMNYTFVADRPVDDEMKLYIWTEADLEANEELTLENASEVFTMKESSGGTYTGRSSGISARKAGKTIYACGVYESEGVEYRTGVLTYSVAAYCKAYANRQDSDFQAMASLAAVYTYCANAYLGD